MGKCVLRYDCFMGYIWIIWYCMYMGFPSMEVSPLAGWFMMENPIRYECFDGKTCFKIWLLWYDCFKIWKSKWKQTDLPCMSMCWWERNTGNKESRYLQQQACYENVTATNEHNVPNSSASIFTTNTDGFVWKLGTTTVVGLSQCLPVEIQFYDV